MAAHRGPADAGADVPGRHPPEARSVSPAWTPSIPSSLRRRSGLIALLAVLAAGATIGGAGVLIYRSESEGIAAERYAQLEAVGELNVRQVVAWRQERLADVRVTAGSPLIREVLERWPPGPPDVALRSALVRHLALIVEAYGYEHALVTDRAGRPLVASGSGHAVLDASARALIARVLATRAPALADTFYIDADASVDPHLHVDAAAPIAGQDGAPVAVLILRADPAAGLFSQLRAWPTPDGTGQAFLVRRVGDEVAILGARDGDREPLAPTMVAASRGELPAVQAAMRARGRYDGPDHRGVEVLSDLREVPDSSWALVTSMASAGIAAESGYRTGFDILLILLIALLVGGASMAVVGARQRDLIGRLFRAESEREAITRHYRRIGGLARDSVFLFDQSGRVVEANLAAERAYGYSADELRGLNVNDLRAPEDRPARDDHWEAAARPGGVLFEIRQRRRDGSTFPAEVSAHSIALADQAYRHSIVRDITERRRAEEELREQLSELRRWHTAVLDREARILELKHEVNALLADSGDAPRYDSVVDATARTAAQEGGS